jgi:putative redox protein
MMTIIGIKANQKQISLQGMSCDLEKHMTTSPPRRIQKLVVKLHLPIQANHPERHLLEAAAHSCPVHHSLHPDIEIDLQFIYQ